MVAVRYADMHKQQGSVQITSMGTVDGPTLSAGGDGWQQVATLPQAKLPAGVGQYAIVVSGRIANISCGPPAPASHVTTGLVQVCMGTTFGSRHPDYCVSLPAAETLAALQGLSFQFLVVITTGLADSVWGTSWDNDSGSEFGIFARLYTNGGPLDWAGSFTVEDVSFLWWDLVRIPATEWFLADAALPPGTAWSTTLSDQVRTAAAIGAIGEEWAVWHQHNYLCPATAGQLVYAPRIQALSSPSGVGGNTRTGAGTWNKYGMSRGCVVAGTREAEVHHGGLFVEQITTGTHKFAIQAAVVQVAPTTPHPRRHRLFGVRLDRLTDFAVRRDLSDQPQGVSVLGPWWTSWIVKERPKPNPPTVTEPIMIATGECHAATGGVNGYTPAIYDTSAGFWYYEAGTSVADFGRFEGVSATVYARNIFTASSPALQIRTTFIGDPTTPPNLGVLQGFTIVWFHPVRDPDDQPTGPGTAPTPLIVNPGTQGPDPASLPVPPVPWNGDVAERGDRDVQAIDGLTGYRRTWPTFTRPERVFAISWGPLAEADAYDLVAWLRANPAWRFTPAGDSDCSVLNMQPPELIAQTHRTFVVSMTIAELVYTG